MNKAIEALKKMHSLEKFAVEIYRTQIGAFSDKEISERLQIAKANEQEHVDNLGKRIRDLNGDCSWLGMFFQIAGKLLGFTTTLLDKAFLLKTDIWFERQAVGDYTNFLQGLGFDEESRKLIQRNIEDEKLHIRRWEESLEILKEKQKG